MYLSTFEQDNRIENHYQEIKKMVKCPKCGDTRWTRGSSITITEDMCLKEGFTSIGLNWRRRVIRGRTHNIIWENCRNYQCLWAQKARKRCAWVLVYQKGRAKLYTRLEKIFYYDNAYFEPAFLNIFSFDYKSDDPNNEILISILDDINSVAYLSKNAVYLTLL